MTSSPVSFPTSPARLSSRLKRNYIPLLGVFLAIANSFFAALLCRLSLCCKSVVTQHKDNFAETSPADTSTSHFLLVHAALLLPHSLYSRIIAVFFFSFFFLTPFWERYILYQNTGVGCCCLYGLWQASCQNRTFGRTDEVFGGTGLESESIKHFLVNPSLGGQRCRATLGAAIWSQLPMGMIVYRLDRVNCHR